MHNDGKVKKTLYRLLVFIPDKWFLSLKFYKHFHRFIDWKNPKTFNEKLQWLKLYNRKPEYTTMVDKYEAKKYVASIIGDEYIIPTLGVWDRAEDIDFDALPDKFVLKATHDSGRVIICKDKSKLDRKAAVEEMKKSLKRDFYAITREWPYKNVKPRIIAEQLLNPKSDISFEIDQYNKIFNHSGLADFKFFCFNGNVDCVMLCLERESQETKFYFFDKEWNLLRYNKRGINTPANFTLPKPPNIDKMFEIAEKLSRGLIFSRIDLYCVDDKIYFGEITLFPQSGMDANFIESTDEYFGNLINIKQVKNEKISRISH